MVGVRIIDSQAKAVIAAQAALEKHAEDVVIMDLRSLSTVTDFFVIGTAGSARQMAAITTHIEATLATQDCPVWHTEGPTELSEPMRELDQELQWVLMDCGEIVVHLLDRRARSFYRLEDLWADAPRVPVTS